MSEMSRTNPTTSMTAGPRTWNELAELVAALVDADDPRLQHLVLALERETGCSLGTPDRSAPMMGRRFARAHRATRTDLLPAGLELAGTN